MGCESALGIIHRPLRVIVPSRQWSAFETIQPVREPPRRGQPEPADLLPVDLEHLGDLGLGEAAVIVEVEHQTLVVRQLADLFVEFGQDGQSPRIMRGVGLVERG